MSEIILSDFFTTKTQAAEFSARLNSIAEKIYKVDFNLEEILVEEFGLTKKDKFMAILRENGVSPQSNSATNSFFQQIQKLITTLPVVSLTLAIQPGEKDLKLISDWFLLNLKHQMLIEFNVNEELIAGATIEFQGKHSDASIRPEFEKAYVKILENI